MTTLELCRSTVERVKKLLNTAVLFFIITQCMSAVHYCMGNRRGHGVAAKTLEANIITGCLLV